MPEQITDQTSIGDIVLEWTFPEYEKYSRSRRWYIIAGIVGGFFILYGMLTGNFLFALIIALSAIILFLQQHQTPAEISFAITDLGVIVSNRLYLYKELESFYIIYQPPEIKTLFLETKSLIRPLLRIPLQDQDPVEVRFSLLEFMTEDAEKEEEPASDAASRNWKLQ